MTSYFEVSNGIYNVGNSSPVNGLDCNPYLLIDGDEAVLFDPGSPLDFDDVYENISALISPERIHHVVLHHNDSDFCSAVPLLEQKGMNFKVVTSWRTMTLIQFYGVKSEYYLVEEHKNQLTLKSGRVLEFVPTPYLHFAGAFTTYDKKTKLLFSSDLFGAFSHNHTRYAEDDYLQKMLTFHEHYMPSNAIIRPVMDLLLQYDISMILPQHGSIINSDIRKYIRALRSLECGTMLIPLKKGLLESGGYTMLINEISERLCALYTCDEVHSFFQKLTYLSIDENHHITAYAGMSIDIWNQLFSSMEAEKGMEWLIILEPYVRTLCSTYDVPLPEVFTSIIETANKTNKKLSDANKELDQTIQLVQERLIKCPVTGLYNEVFLRSLLLKELETVDWREIGILALVNIDDFSKFKFQFGQDSDRDVLKTLTYLLTEAFGSSSVFRLQTADFGIYGKGYNREDFIEKVEQLRMDISNSDAFLTPITVSIGVVFPEEIDLDVSTYENTIDNYMKYAGKRLHTAKKQGKNRVCYSGSTASDEGSPAKVLVVDSDEVNLDVIRNFIHSEGIDVLTATDGEMAYTIAKAEQPKLIITDTVLPKLDGFLLRERLLSTSDTKNIETVFLSYQKDSASVERALDLGVSYYLKKPYLLSELIGIVKRTARSK